MRIFLPFCAFFSLVFFVHGQNENIHGQLTFEYLTIDEGLTDNRVNALTQDDFGFIWMGTDRGVNRYDGNELRSYTHFWSGDTLELRFEQMRVAINDRFGDLWLGGLSGIVKYNRNLDRFEMVTFNGKKYDCNDIEKDKDGSLWFALNGVGALHFDPATSEVITYEYDPENPNSLPVRSTYQILVDHLGNVWMGTFNSGLVYFDRSANTFTHFIADGEKGSLAGHYVNRIYEDPDHTIWVTHHQFKGISKYNAQTKTFKNIFPDPDIMESGRVKDLLIDPDGNFWVGGMAGLYLFNKDLETFKRYASIDHPISRLSHNSIQVMMLDRHQGLWLGTYAGGVSYTHLYSSNFIHYPYSPFTNEYYLNDKNVYSIAVGRNDDLWVGTENGGVNHLNRKNGKFSYYKRDTKDQQSLFSNNIKSIYVDDHSEYVWIGTYRGGLSRLDPQSGSFKNYFYSEEFSHSQIFKVQPDLVDPNLLWIGSNVGLWIFDKKSEKFNKIDESYWNVNEVPEHVKSERIFDIAEVNQIMIVATEGVTLYDKKTGILNHMDEIGGVKLKVVPFLLVDRTKAIWFYSNHHLFRMTTDGDQQVFGENDGLPEVEFLSGQEDLNGDIWMSSNAGLYRFSNLTSDTDTMVYQIYTKTDNLQSKQFIYGSSAKSDDGELFFGGINGFNSFHPQDVEKDQYMPFLHVSELIIEGKKVQPGQEIYGKILLSQPVMNTDSLTISHKVKSFSFSLNALHYSASSDNLISYTLENYDDQWTTVKGASSTVTYTNLPAGDYIFRLKGANSSGLWSTEVRSIYLTVLPPWWGTWWFRMMVILAIGIAIFSFLRWRLNIQREQRELLTEKVRQATDQISFQNDELQAQSENLKNAITETNFVIQESIESGNFTERIDLQEKSGEWLNLGKSINGLFDSILKPFNQINTVVDAMAKGDLSKRMLLESKGDILALSENLNHALDNLSLLLKEIIMQVGKIGIDTAEMSLRTHEMNNNTEEIAGAISEMSEGANVQVSKVDETSRRIELILNISGNIASEAEHINREATKGVAQSEHGRKLIEGVGDAMHTLLAFSNESKGAIDNLSVKSMDIGRVMSIIREIATQTNLLALNAAIEAAKAGESGRGFAVVAEEIRKLAESSASSTLEIESLINEVQNSTGHTAGLIAQMIERVKEGDSASMDAIKSFKEISSSYEKTLSLSETIVNSTKGQTLEVNAVVKETENIVAIAEETASGTEEVAASSSELSKGMTLTKDRFTEIAGIVEDLKEKVQKFYLGRSNKE